MNYTIYNPNSKPKANRPLFIIFNDNDLKKCKDLLEKIIDTEVVIANISEYKGIYVPADKYNEALIAGLKIAEKECFEGIWLDIYFNARSLNCLPLKEYEIKSSYFGCIFSSNDKSELDNYKKEKQRIKNYLNKLQRYLNHQLVVKYYITTMKLEISIICTLSEYENLKRKLLIFENTNTEELIQSYNDNYNDILIR